jgi:hypothetical protein
VFLERANRGFPLCQPSIRGEETVNDMRLHTETELAVGTGRVVRVRVRPPARRITLRCAAFGKRPLESSPVQLTRVVFPRARCVAASDPAWSPPVRAMRAAEHSAAVRPLEQAEDAARRAPNALRDDTHDAPTGGEMPTSRQTWALTPVARLLRARLH